MSIAGVLPTELQLACDPELDVSVELELAIDVFVSELSVRVRTYFSGDDGATGETGGDETRELSTESLSSLSSSVVWLR